MGTQLEVRPEAGRLFEEVTQGSPKPEEVSFTRNGRRDRVGPGGRTVLVLDGSEEWRLACLQGRLEIQLAGTQLCHSISLSPCPWKWAVRGVVWGRHLAASPRSSCLQMPAHGWMPGRTLTFIGITCPADLLPPHPRPPQTYQPSGAHPHKAQLR